ncbi:MbtH family protein [Teredinibacter haidensis]|uniref:MbtH family protein n=1 Tax=Teredinibacter haidensis TaxID=2731755 RepID=UPI00094892DF|nr:MbtH family protein [Teredinibacter haidensis]
MTTMNEDYVNPFDNEAHSFVVLVNNARQYSLWPTFAEQPGGWNIQFGPSDRSACLTFIERNWKDGVLFPSIDVIAE